MSSSRSRKAVPGAKDTLEQFKYEIADEIGVDVPDDGYWGEMTSKQCGAVGGMMVKKLIEMAESQLIGRK